MNTTRIVFVLMILFSGTLAAESESIIVPDRRPSIDAIEQALVDQQQWLTNTIGITDQVPPPWQDITVITDEDDDIELTLLHRRYRFDDTMFPSAIETLGRSILADPITLTIVDAKGKSRTVDPSVMAVTDKRKNEINGFTLGKASGVNVYAAHHIEYDGFIWTNAETQSG